MSKRLRRPVTALLGTMSLAAASGILTLAPAQSVPAPADADCPQTYPVADLVKDQPVDGLTVSSGTTPDTFTGTVLGTIVDGIAPGLDLIVVRLTSPEIDRVGGIWEGMSGSPVYATDGRLIGAVSYGLASGSSPVAGVTPAEDMKALLATSPTPQLRTAKRVALRGALLARVTASAATTSSEAASGLERLRVPVGVSGLSSARMKRASTRLNLGDVRLYRSAPAAAAPLSGGDPQIFAGSNLAASMSYGDLSAVGTGTTTMVCNGTVVGFGHPFNFAGDTTLTMHGASAVYVQEDTAGAPFKVTNPTGPVGTVDEDRMVGIKGELGAAPPSTLVRTVVAGPTGRSRVGDTRVSLPDFVSAATAMGDLLNLDRVFDHTGKGTATVRFTISGHTTAGTPFTLTRGNRVVDDDDVSYASTFEPAADVDAVIGNDFTGVTLDQVRIDTSLSEQVRRFHIAKVQVRVKGAWHAVGTESVVRVRHGGRVLMRVVLRSRRNELGSKVVSTRLSVPASLVPGSTGAVVVGSAGGGSDSGDGDGAPSTAEPTSFAQLLRTLATAPRNDELALSLQLDSEESPSVQTRTQTGVVVTGQTAFQVRVR